MSLGSVYWIVPSQYPASDCTFSQSNADLWLCFPFPESSEVPQKQAVGGARPELPEQLQLRAQRSQSSGHPPG